MDTLIEKYRIGRTSTNGKVFELFCYKNPHARFFGTELLESDFAELWELSQNSFATHHSTVAHPFYARHIEMMRRNVELAENGQSIFRMRYFDENGYRSPNESKIGMICRIISEKRPNYFEMEKPDGQIVFGSNLSNED